MSETNSISFNWILALLRMHPEEEHPFANNPMLIKGIRLDSLGLTIERTTSGILNYDYWYFAYELFFRVEIGTNQMDFYLGEGASLHSFILDFYRIEDQRRFITSLLKRLPENTEVIQLFDQKTTTNGIEK